MARYCNHVHSKEPNLTAIKFLSSWTAGFKEITPYNRAVWSETCELDLKKPILNGVKRHRFATLLHEFLDLKNIERWNTSIVQTVVLEDIGFADSKHRLIFKCDMEGAKSNIIKSLVNGFESGAIGMIEVSRQNNPNWRSFLSLIGKVADIFVASSEDKLTL